MALEQGSARINAWQAKRKKEIAERDAARDRARGRAYTRLANLHPHEWNTLLEAALKEEGLTD